MHLSTFWLIAGVVLVLVEAFGLPGAGILFTGLGAITTGIVLYLELIGEDAVVTQWIICFAATAVWAALLWKPLKKLRGTSATYSNILGQTGFVGSSGITRKNGGEVTWSGTIMKAQLAPEAPEKLEAGSQVIIVGVTGATLIVKPRE